MKFFALLAFFLAFAVASAQMGPTPPPPYKSLDTKVINSWLVVIGKVVGVENYRGVVQVQDMIKGEKVDRLYLQLPGDPETYKKTGHRLLIWGNNDRDNGPNVIDLDSKDIAAFTADLKILRNADEIVRYVKGIAGRNRGRFDTTTFPITVPTSLIAGTALMGGYYVWDDTIKVEVPVDQALLKWAKKAILAKDVSSRAEGIAALRYFKSEENQALVKSFLGDPGWTPRFWTDENRMYLRRDYEARRAAYEQLFIFYGVYVPRPVTDEPSAKDGFLVGLDLSPSATSSPNFKELPGLKELAHLDISGVTLAPADVEAIAQTTSLQAIVGPGSNIDDEKLKTLAGLPNLAYLNLENTAVTDKGLETLAAMKSLKRVELGQNVTAKGIADLRKRRPGLKIAEDELAFLAPFHPRRIEVPFARTRAYKVGNPPDLDDFRVHTFILYFPRSSEEAVRKALAAQLPKLGWKPRYDRYYRPEVTAFTGVRNNPEIIEFSMDWLYPLKEGDDFPVVVTLRPSG